MSLMGHFSFSVSDYTTLEEVCEAIDSCELDLSTLRGYLRGLKERRVQLENELEVDGGEADRG
jgi:hypothetical protein